MADRLVVKGRGGPIYIEIVEEKRMRVKFNQTYLHEWQGRMQGTEYQKDGVYELNDSFANKFINRKVAEETTDKVSPENYKAPVEEVAEEEEETEAVRRAPKATTSKDVGKKK